jgi:EAL domain-containing protein (putative c-di-GMP-specific phosphodiesterase class I)
MTHLTEAKSDTGGHRCYRLICLCLLLCCAFRSLEEAVQAELFGASPTVVRMAVALSRVSEDLFYYALFRYFLLISGKLQQSKPIWRVLLFLPAAIVIVPDVLIPVLRIANGNPIGESDDATILAIRIFVLFGYYVAALAYNARFRAAYPIRVRRVLGWALLLPVTGRFLSFIIPVLPVALFADSILCLLLYMTMENPGSRVNLLTETLNATAISDDIRAGCVLKFPFTVLDIRALNLRQYDGILGEQDRIEMNRSIATSLKKRAKDETFYTLAYGHYAVLIRGDDKEKRSSVLSALEERFEREFEVDAYSVSLTAAITPVNVPEDTAELDAIMAVIGAENSLFEGKNGEACQTTLSGLHNYMRMEQAVRVAGTGKNLKLYLRPIIDVHTRKISHLEAHLRLWEPQLGWLSADQFMPIAERDGQMTDLVIATLGACCRLINEEEIERLGDGMIHLALSGYQIFNEDLINRAVEMLKAYKIPRSLFTLEMSEEELTSRDSFSVSLGSKLHELGFYMVIDHFGKGDTNLIHMMRMQLDGVKIDPHILQLVKDDEHRTDMLRAMIRALKETGKTIFQSGVTSDEELTYLEEIGCDYAEGDGLWKEMSVEELREVMWEQHAQKQWAQRRLALGIRGERIGRTEGLQGRFRSEATV